MYCVNCGKQLTEGARFCFNCGCPAVILPEENKSAYANMTEEMQISGRDDTRLTHFEEILKHAEQE